MNALLQLIRELPAGKKAIIVILIVIIIVTWVAVCAILASYPAVRPT